MELENPAEKVDLILRYERKLEEASRESYLARQVRNELGSRETIERYAEALEREIAIRAILRSARLGQLTCRNRSMS